MAADQKDTKLSEPTFLEMQFLYRKHRRKQELVGDWKADKAAIERWYKAYRDKGKLQRELVEKRESERRQNEDLQAAIRAAKLPHRTPDVPTPPQTRGGTRAPRKLRSSVRHLDTGGVTRRSHTGHVR